MNFLKCKKCDHVDTYDCFTSRAGRSNLPPVCPRCFNDKHNIIELGSEISCSDCVYHTLIAGSCSHPDNTPNSDFWNRPQSSCYLSKVTVHNNSPCTQTEHFLDVSYTQLAGK